MFQLASIEDLQFGAVVAKSSWARGGPRMANALDKRLERRVSAGIVDAGTAARIKTFEESQSSSERLRWPVLLAVALGGGLLCAGVLLFVAAHWGVLSPAWGFRLGRILVAVVPI